MTIFLFLFFWFVSLKLCYFLTSLSHTGSVALQSSHGSWSQLLHCGPRSCWYAPPRDGKGPLRTNPRGPGPHHGAGSHHSGDCALQSRSVQQGQKGDGLLWPQKVSHVLSWLWFFFFYPFNCCSCSYSWGFEFQATFTWIHFLCYFMCSK